ncbi:MAG: hypothetical protein HQL61_09910 [Magnetococcales bacterium]|nr:hypothetical protein [Nitrospirota bacterium]
MKKKISKSGDNGNVRRSEFEELKGMFGELRDMFLVMMQKQDRMGDKLDRVATDVETLKVDVGTLKADVGTLKVDVGTLKVDVGTLKVDVGTLKADVGTLKVDVGTLKADVGTLKVDVTSIKREVAGLSRSVSYALENEAYRELPMFLKARYGIEVLDSLIRVELKKDSEINILGEGRRHSKPVLIVGEAKLRLQGYYTAGTPNNAQMIEVFEQLERHVEAVRLQCSGVEADTKEIVRILITHFATADFLTEASKRGVIVIQSYEWQAV